MNNDRVFDNSPNITPINKVNTEQNNIKSINTNNSNPPKEDQNDFVHSLPNWDLTPPYETVRRINRI